MKLDNCYFLEYSDYWPHLYWTLLYWTHGAVDKVFGWKMLLSKIIWKLLVQSQQQVRITRNTYYNLTLVPGHGLQNWNSLPKWFK